MPQFVLFHEWFWAMHVHLCDFVFVLRSAVICCLENFMWRTFMWRTFLSSFNRSDRCFQVIEALFCVMNSLYRGVFSGGRACVWIPFGGEKILYYNLKWKIYANVWTLLKMYTWNIPLPPAFRFLNAPLCVYALMFGLTLDQQVRQQHSSDLAAAAMKFAA